MEAEFLVQGDEGALHRAWFEIPENQRKFKERFCRFIRKRYPVGGAELALTARPEPSSW